jgi:hypothetical protein
MLRSIFFIKFVHTLIFFVLSGCIGFVLYCAIADRITLATWIALVLVAVECIVVWINGWRCPLTIYVEKLGAMNSAVADIFLPKWFADRLFPICGATWGITLAIFLLRLLL